MSDQASITDTDRIEAIHRNRWRIEDDGLGPYVYVGPIRLEGKPWGVGKTLRDAIDDAIRSTGFSPPGAAPAGEGER